MPDKTPHKRIAVIMAGGSGERFWPLSRQQKPKQLLCLTQPDKTMLEEAIDRIARLLPLNDIYVQTMPHLLECIRAARLAIPDENVIAEPCKRNTAGCLCYAVAFLRAKLGAEFTMAVLTADHAIGDSEAFVDTARKAMELAESNNALLTLGIVPTRPETGYGYIEVETKNLDGVYTVKTFREKPTLHSAQRFLSSGNFYWNSGMFFWRSDVFLSAFDAINPEFSSVARKMTEYLAAGYVEKAEEEFETLDSISIDFALMEKAKNTLMLPANFLWDDVGSLLAIERGREQDADGNTTQGECILLNSRNSIVINETNTPQHAVGVIGLEDVVVVVCDDAVLLAAKDQVENVRQVVDSLRERRAPQI